MGQYYSLPSKVPSLAPESTPLHGAIRAQTSSSGFQIDARINLFWCSVWAAPLCIEKQTHIVNCTRCLHHQRLRLFHQANSKQRVDEHSMRGHKELSPQRIALLTSYFVMFKFSTRTIHACKSNKSSYSEIAEFTQIIFTFKMKTARLLLIYNAARRHALNHPQKL